MKRGVRRRVAGQGPRALRVPQAMGRILAMMLWRTAFALGGWAASLNEASMALMKRAGRLDAYAVSKQTYAAGGVATPPHSHYFIGEHACDIGCALGLTGKTTAPMPPQPVSESAAVLGLRHRFTGRLGT